MINWTEWNRVLYSGWAPFYDVLVAMLEDKRRASMELADVRPKERVLLLGAGTGLDLKYLPGDADITAIDISPAMVGRLKRRAADLGVGVNAQVMDGQSLEFASNSFDVVILHFVLAVIPDPLRAINEVERVLKPDGRAVILNKFAEDDAEPSVVLRLANKVVRPLITDITCQLKPIVQASGLQPMYVQKLGAGGFFKVAMLQKRSDTLNREMQVTARRESAGAITEPSFA
jgi:ubiquinone/menaquinone biosynthesis C-methylase UbiE